MVQSVQHKDLLDRLGLGMGLLTPEQMLEQAAVKNRNEQFEGQPNAPQLQLAENTGKQLGLLLGGAYQSIRDAPGDKEARGFFDRLQGHMMELATPPEVKRQRETIRHAEQWRASNPKPDDENEEQLWFLKSIYSGAQKAGDDATAIRTLQEIFPVQQKLAEMRDMKERTSIARDAEDRANREAEDSKIFETAVGYDAAGNNIGKFATMQGGDGTPYLVNTATGERVRTGTVFFKDKNDEKAEAIYTKHQRGGWLKELSAYEAVNVKRAGLMNIFSEFMTAGVNPDIALQKEPGVIVRATAQAVRGYDALYELVSGKKGGGWVQFKDPNTGEVTETFKNDQHARDTILDRANKGNLVDKFGRVVNLSNYSEEAKAMLIALAYGEAKAAEQGGGRLSDQDIANWMNSLGDNSGKVSVIMQRLAQRMQEDSNEVDKIEEILSVEDEKYRAGSDKLISRYRSTRDLTLERFNIKLGETAIDRPEVGGGLGSPPLASPNANMDFSKMSKSERAAAYKTVPPGSVVDFSTIPEDERKAAFDSLPQGTAIITTKGARRNK